MIRFMTMIGDKMLHNGLIMPGKEKILHRDACKGSREAVLSYRCG
jgi:hypothetical protein